MKVLTNAASCGMPMGPGSTWLHGRHIGEHRPRPKASSAGARSWPRRISGSWFGRSLCGVPTGRYCWKNSLPACRAACVMIREYSNGTASRRSTKCRSKPKSRRPAGQGKQLFRPVRQAHRADIDTSPELLDSLWGIYFATGSYRRCRASSPCCPGPRSATASRGSRGRHGQVHSRQQCDAQPRSARHAQARQPPPAASVAPDPRRGDRSRRERSRGARPQGALAAIDELKTKARLPARLSLWGKVGEGALAIGCIAGSSRRAGPVRLPCVIGRHVVGRAAGLGRAEVGPCTPYAANESVSAPPGLHASASW